MARFGIVRRAGACRVMAAEAKTGLVWCAAARYGSGGRDRFGTASHGVVCTGPAAGHRRDNALVRHGPQGQLTTGRDCYAVVWCSLRWSAWVRQQRSGRISLGAASKGKAVREVTGKQGTGQARKAPEGQYRIGPYGSGMPGSGAFRQARAAVNRKLPVYGVVMDGSG